MKYVATRIHLPVDYVLTSFRTVRTKASESLAKTETSSMAQPSFATRSTIRSYYPMRSWNNVDRQSASTSTGTSAAHCILSSAEPAQQMHLMCVRIFNIHFFTMALTATRISFSSHKVNPPVTQTHTIPTPTCFSDANIQVIPTNVSS